MMMMKMNLGPKNVNRFKQKKKMKRKKLYQPMLNLWYGLIHNSIGFLEMQS